MRPHNRVQVPLFQHMDDLVLENICDRVKSLIFPKGEVVSSTTSNMLVFFYRLQFIYFLVWQKPRLISRL